MKRLISLALALTMMVCLAVSASAASVNMTASSTNVNVGDKVTVTLKLDQTLEKVSSLEYWVWFDAEKVKLVDSANGTASSKTQISALGAEPNYKITIVDTESVGLTVNAGTLYTLTFEAIKAGKANFRLEYVGVSDTDWNDLGVTATGNITVSIPCKEHAWDEGKVTQEQECEKDEITTYTCTVCGETKTEVTKKATGKHELGEPVVVDATCTEPGSKTQTCKICGKEVVEEIPATGHKPSDDTVIDKEATCEEDGLMHGTCAVCGEKMEDEVIPALGHDYKLDSEKAPTCTEKGYKKYVCSRDNTHVKTDEIDALGHKWGAWTEDKENGKHVRTCETCKETESADHNWDSGKKTVAETCVTEGEMTYVCKDCKAVKTEVIPATGVHEYTAKYEYEEGSKNHTAYCVCGETVVEEHDYSINGEVIENPTTSKEGKQEMLCVCGAKTIKTLPKKEANLDKVPKTDDITGQLVLGGVSIAAVLACAWYLLRRKLAK